MKINEKNNSNNHNINNDNNTNNNNNNNIILQGLILKYQFMLANSMGGRAAATGSDGAVNAQRMRALEGQVLQAKMESNESKEDAAKASGNPCYGY